MGLPTKFHRYASALSAWLETSPPGRPFPSSRRMLAKRLRREPGGGSLPAPDTCRPITSEYAQEAHSWGPDETRAAIGLTFDELAALTTEDFYTLARKKPLELIGLLQMHGLASSVWTLFPADVRSVIKDVEARKAGR